VTGPGGLTTRVSGPVSDLALQGQGPLALFNRILDPRRLEGPASFDLRLTGPGLEFLEGTVTTEGASLADPSLGEAIRGIRGTATLGGGRATLALTGALATGGTLAVSGPLGILSPFDADLSVTGQGLVIRDPALYEAFGDAALTVTGPLAGGARIAGTATLSRVEGRVPASDVGALGELPPVFHIEPSVPVVDTLRRAGLSPSGEEINPETGATRGGGTPYGLDVLINAPARVFVRGRGLDVELGGALRLAGDTTNVIPIGQFSLIRGRLDLLGQRFDLTEGLGHAPGRLQPLHPRRGRNRGAHRHRGPRGGGRAPSSRPR
jgi:autotransporter translocation and assembly factor TamB